MPTLSNNVEYTPNMFVYDTNNTYINTRNYIIRDTHIINPNTQQTYKFKNLSSVPFTVNMDKCEPCSKNK